MRQNTFTQVKMTYTLNIYIIVPLYMIILTPIVHQYTIVNTYLKH